MKLFSKSVFQKKIIINGCMFSHQNIPELLINKHCTLKFVTADLVCTCSGAIVVPAILYKPLFSTDSC